MFCLGGGIGMRGFGEIKLEIECWVINVRIFCL